MAFIFESLEGSDNKLRISFVATRRTINSVIVETFQTPFDSTLTAMAFTDKRHPDRKLVATMPFADSSGADISVAFLSDGHFGPLEDFSYWWEDGIPETLPVNKEVPYWAYDAFYRAGR